MVLQFQAYRCFKNLSLIAAALFSFSGAAKAAEPAGDWVVGPIQAQSSSGKSYCSMKNSYAGGLTLVFAQDAAGANSIAIDFGKKTLAAGSQYLLTLNAGPIRRMMVSIAATTDVLIVQMGNDPDFYEMLASKNALYVEFNNQQLTFGLAGTGQALTQLDACATQVGAGKSFAKTNVKPSPVVSSGDDTPPPVLSSLKSEEGAAEMNGIQAANQVAAQPQISARGPNAPDNRDIKLSQQALGSSMLEEVERLEKEKHRLIRENQALASRLKVSDREAAQVDASQMADFERRERALEIENARLREMLTTRQQPEDVAMANTVASAVSIPLSEPAVDMQMQHPQMPQQAQSLPWDLTAWMRGVAGVPATVQAVSSETGVQAWRWQRGDIFIAVQELPINAEQDMQKAAANYIAVMKSRCTGDFAQRMAPGQKNGDVAAMTAEVACMDDVNDAAAGLAFVADPARMVVITYESSTDEMSAMLEQRDLLISRVYAKQFP